MAKPECDHPTLGWCAFEMYMLLTDIGRHLNGEHVDDTDELRDRVAGLLRHVGGYYLRQDGGS